MNTSLTMAGAWLITPPRAGRFDSALRACPDVALLDLEDSVRTESKDAARVAALAYLNARRGQDEGVLTGLRINSPGTVHGLKDLAAIADSGVCDAVVLVPKVESARDIDLVSQALDAERQRLSVWALIETPRAILRLDAVLATAQLQGVVFGAADYAAATGCRTSAKALLWARSALAAGAAAAGIPAIDSPYFDLDDADGLRTHAEEARELGYAGKGAVHPDQLPIIREAFSPTAAEIAAARAIVAAADEAGGDMTRAGGHMVGPPLVAAARALLARTTKTLQASNPQEAADE
ncbi:HpcH/HpaI aldolase/citrate lyase family protein [Streptomyces sp. NPDC056056]|uniref:HpcH/HpaI aldolase/citrate lyase family protein n=1 Tax=Streptomyces sp. NPDC056056 TaxID=3345698 RepID=UPI0035DD9A02